MALELIALSLNDAIAIAEDDNSFYAHAVNADDIADVLGDAAAAQADLYEQTNAEAPWVAYLAYDTESNEIVGICTFKDMPEDGMVEIAFYTFPGYEGRGWASKMAAALIDIAWKTGEVDTIFAHTEAVADAEEAERAEDAAAHIVKKLGFAFVGPMDYPEGIVWQWELRRA